MSPYLVIACRLGGRDAEIDSYSTKRGACVCTRTGNCGLATRETLERKVLRPFA
jgi:hypothetical protein